MKILIDAWLERKDPQIRFIDAETATVLLQLGPSLTLHLLEHGEISIEDLLSAHNPTLANLFFRLIGIPIVKEAF